MEKSKIVTVSYSSGYDYKDEFVEGIQIDIDNEAYAFHRTKDLQFAIKSLAKLQNRGYIIKFLENKNILSKEEIGSYIEIV